MIQLLKGDCLEVLQGYPDNYFACIVTSCPYNLGVNYPGYNDSIPRNQYLDWCGRWLSELRRVASDDASLFLNVGGKPTDPIVPELVLLKALEAKWQVQSKFVWCKSITIEKDGKEISVGHYKPLNSERFVNDCWEPVYQFSKDEGEATANDAEMLYQFSKFGNVKLSRKAPGVGVAYSDKSNEKRWGGGALRCRGNVWYIPYTTKTAADDISKDYPAQFPVELPKRCLALHGLDKLKAQATMGSGKVLDPFSGTGTTMQACQELGLNGVGIELSEEGHQLAKRRLGQ